MNIQEVNALSCEQFIETFKNAVEMCPLVAAGVWRVKEYVNVDDLCGEFSSFIDSLPRRGKIGILRCHPDLAGRLAAAGQITDESKLEQKAAGLDDMTEDEKYQLQTFNNRYKENFGFPFIICAKENKKDSIMKGIEKRLENSVDTELITGIEEVKKICNLRLRAIVHSKAAKL